jgi:general secretion pathway protein G
MCYYPLYYGHGSRNLPCSDNRVQKVSRRGFTLIEIMIVVAIIGTLSAVAVPNYLKYKEKGKIAVAQTDIRIIEKQINIYAIDTGELPDSLNDLSISNPIDPWNNPYQYLRIDGGDVKGKGQFRKDHFLVPVNTDYDLYSMGKDGKSQAPFTAKASQDDIVRANNGGFVGLVSDY